MISEFKIDSKALVFVNFNGRPGSVVLQCEFDVVEMQFLTIQLMIEMPVLPLFHSGEVLRL